MEVAAMATGAGTTAAATRAPFQREVREWQHVDPNTGALLTGRLEADRWVNGPLNSYGKRILVTVVALMDCSSFYVMLISMGMSSSEWTAYLHVELREMAMLACML
uniref:Uncharacterized protein n=1 Tax=Anopheles maculatus TaxID=74869 RepID=A0A182TCG1_9DIPT